MGLVKIKAVPGSSLHKLSCAFFSEFSLIINLAQLVSPSVALPAELVLIVNVMNLLIEASSAVR